MFDSAVGHIVFDLLLFAWVAMGWFPCCCGSGCVAGCPQCAGGEGPCQFEVELSGFGDGTCGSCDANHPAGLLGTFLLDWDPGRVCTWGYELAGGGLICGSGELKIELEAVGSDVELRVRLWNPAGGIIQADWLYTCVGCWDDPNDESSLDCFDGGPWTPTLDFASTQCDYAAGSVTVDHI